jgi:hypothetical protein
VTLVDMCRQMGRQAGGGNRRKRMPAIRRRDGCKGLNACRRVAIHRAATSDCN